MKTKENTIDMFYKRIEELLSKASFSKLWWMKFSLNFTSTKFIALIISLGFFFIGKIPVELFGIILAGYAGINVYQDMKKRRK